MNKLTTTLAAARIGSTVDQALRAPIGLTRRGQVVAVLTGYWYHKNSEDAVEALRRIERELPGKHRLEAGDDLTRDLLPAIRAALEEARS